MKRSSHERNEVRIPDVEVLIAAAASDVALVCFYVGSSPAQPIEVVTAIRDLDEVGAVVAVLEDCIKAFRAQGWLSLDELDTRTSEEKGGQPF